MRKTLTITAATLLALGTVGGGIALAGNGDQDQTRDRDQTCSTDCDGTPDQVRDRLHDGTGDQARDRLQSKDCDATCDGTGAEHQNRHEYRYRVEARSGEQGGQQSGGQQSGGQQFGGQAGHQGSGECQQESGS